MARKETFNNATRRFALDGSRPVARERRLHSKDREGVWPHQAGLDRVVQAGAKPVSWVALAVELQRDWARPETVQEVVEIVLTERLLKEQ